MKPIWRVFRYLRYYPLAITLHVVFNLLHVVFNLTSFALIIPFVELLFGMTQPPAIAPTIAFDQQSLTDCLIWLLYQTKNQYGVWQCLLAVSGLYIGASLLSNLFRYMALYYMAPIRHGIIQHLRDDVYHKITILPVSYFNARRRGDVISRMSNDLDDVEWSCVTTITALAKDPINILFFVATLIFISPKLCLYFLIILPIAIMLIGVIGKSLKRNSTKGQTKLGQLFSILDESIGGIKTIVSYGQQHNQQQRFEAANNDYAHTMTKVVRRRELGGPLSEILGTIALVAILIIGGTLAFKGELQPSVFIFFVIIFVRLIPPVNSIIKAYNNLQKGNASATRFFQIIDADETIIEQPNAQIIDSFNDRIDYHDVSFAYTPNEADAKPVYVLSHINLSVKKNRTIAIVGPSGAGKTTLVDLLPRFYDCTEGSITLDGIPIKEVNINSLRSLIGLVSQQCILFNDTVANNIGFGQENISIEAIKHAAKMAHADEFIEQLPQGYNTLIGDRGITLSGGQRQRISIARAILKNPPILILDEATSALDAESEHAVQQALQQLMQGRTCVVIAHRLSTIQNADEIVVLDKGQIVEQGTHTTLSTSGGVYQKLIKMQTL
ncbi:MAG: ABC transporter ATP-binding protein [Bacteroidales bacterium]|nr:ABC transporter ATP-binding protein [Candidatus Colimorpha onthohippi]